MDMRADGMNVRQIADETKIPKSTVARINSTVPFGTVELPTVIVGKDGKHRQALQLALNEALARVEFLEVANKKRA